MPTKSSELFSTGVPVSAQLREREIARVIWLVVLGGMQEWWLRPVLLSMSPDAVYFGATGLTAFTDNAALTYLGSLITGISTDAQYMLVAGAVAGGGLTVIANAPNPAGATLLRRGFADETIGAGGLLLGAAGPTLLAAAAFILL